MKYVRLLLTMLLYSSYMALAPFGYVAFALLHRLPTSAPLKRARRLQWIMRRAFTLMHDTLRFFGFIDFDPRRVEVALPQRPSVLVANHPTLVDVTSLLSAYPDVTTIVKPSLFERFWAHGLLDGARFFKGADSTADLPALLDVAATRIAEGFHVLIFPEGTRSPEGQLLPFRRTAFELACRTGAPLVPIVITCEPVWLSKEHPIFPPRDKPARFRMRALPAIDPAAHSRSSRKLRDVVERQFCEHLGVIPVQETRVAAEKDAARLD